MSYAAIAALDDAIAATRDFLTPVTLGRWLRVAFISLFVGTTGFAPPTPSVQFSGDPGTISPMPGFDSGGMDGGWMDGGWMDGGWMGHAWGPMEHGGMMGSWWPMAGSFDPFGVRTALAVAVVLVVSLVVGLAVLYVGSVLEFVLLDALRTDTLRIRRGWRTQHGRGLHLLGFRLLLALPFLALVALTILPPLVFGESAFVLLLVFLPILVLVGVLLAAVNVFTTAFVAPIMLLDDAGVFAAWRDFWPTLRAEWREFGVYALVMVGLAIVAATLVGVVVGLVGFLLAIPVAIVALILVAISGLSSLLGGVLFAGLALVFVCAMLVAVAVVQAPVQVYLRYFNLFVLGDVDANFDLVPDRRRRFGDETDG